MARVSVLVDRLVPADAAELWGLIDRNRSHLNRYGDDIAGKYPTLASVRDRIDNPPAGVWEYRCCIRDARTREMVGFIKLTEIRGLERVAEIGYWLGGEFTGRGYATQAVRFLTHQAIFEFALLEVRAWVHPNNTDSLEVLQRARYRGHGIDPTRPGLLWFSFGLIDIPPLW